MNPKGNQVFLFVLFRKKTSQFHKKDPHVQKNKSQRQHICMYLFRKFEEPVKISNIKYQISKIPILYIQSMIRNILKYIWMEHFP